MKLIKSIKLYILICIIGFFLFMYPFISNYLNSKHSSEVIYEYSNSIDDTEAIIMLNEAKEYNKSLLIRKDQFALTDDQKNKYKELLNIKGNGNIGYITIDAINVKIPIYHGMSSEVLSMGVGHLEWSSLPVGGESTHSVLSAHNGLIGARLFTDLWKVKEGDKFVIHVLNETLTYEVDQIKTIDPADKSDLKIEEGKDLVTLFTCTPYGINTHRLLVRGHRIKDNKEFSAFSPNGDPINKYIEAGLLSIIPLIIFIIIIIVKKNKIKKRVNYEEH